MARKATRKPTDTVQLKLRFSEMLRRRLAREAKRRNCSLNTEIVDRLEQSLLSESFHDAPLSTLTARALLAGLDEGVVNEMVAHYVDTYEGTGTGAGALGTTGTGALGTTGTGTGAGALGTTGTGALGTTGTGALRSSDIRMALIRKRAKEGRS